jgi:hypothetical protein
MADMADEKKLLELKKLTPTPRQYAILIQTLMLRHYVMSALLHLLLLTL